MNLRQQALAVLCLHDPAQKYYLDWLQVAGEEALHFTLLREHLHTLGVDYGDFDAHDGLWSMTERTKHDVVARMALVPRTLEARGLDATPPCRRSFARRATSARWRSSTSSCATRSGVAPAQPPVPAIADRVSTRSHYAQLVERHGAPRLKAPFNHSARTAAGFTAEEIAALGER